MCQCRVCHHCLRQDWFDLGLWWSASPVFVFEADDWVDKRIANRTPSKALLLTKSILVSDSLWSLSPPQWSITGCRLLLALLTKTFCWAYRVSNRSTACRSIIISLLFSPGILGVAASPWNHKLWWRLLSSDFFYMMWKLPSVEALITIRTLDNDRILWWNDIDWYILEVYCTKV